jgi:hypothetical protein
VIVISGCVVSSQKAVSVIAEEWVSTALVAASIVCNKLRVSATTVSTWPGDHAVPVLGTFAVWRASIVALKSSVLANCSAPALSGKKPSRSNAAAAGKTIKSSTLTIAR